MIERCTIEQRERVEQYLSVRFGLEPSLFSPYDMYETSQSRIVLGPKVPFDLRAVDTAGIAIARLYRLVKPTTVLFQTFGHAITENVVIISRVDATAYCAGDDFDLSDDNIGTTTNGFVMVSCDGLPLGCGLLKGHRLINQLPKIYRLKIAGP